MNIFFAILTALSFYFFLGFMLYFALYVLFNLLYTRKEYFKKSNIIVRIVFYFFFALGYLIDIVFNLLWASMAHFILDLASGTPLRNARFMPKVEGLSLTNWKPLTLTYRVQSIINNRFSPKHTYYIAYELSLIINGIVPNHIKYYSGRLRK